MLRSRVFTLFVSALLIGCQRPTAPDTLLRPPAAPQSVGLPGEGNKLTEPYTGRRLPFVPTGINDAGVIVGYITCAPGGPTIAFAGLQVVTDDGIPYSLKIGERAPEAGPSAVMTAIVISEARITFSCPS